MPGVVGAYVATGHSVWGILNAPATGEAMAELIVGGAAHTADLWLLRNVDQKVSAFECADEMSLPSGV